MLQILAQGIAFFPGKARNLSVEEAEKYLQSKGISVYGEDLPRPCQALEDFECLPEVCLGRFTGYLWY